MELRKSERKNTKIKLALQGSAGAGKTFSSILLAKGLANGDLSKVVIIDTEAGSADLYAHLGNYNVISLKPPFTPTNYIQAIDTGILYVLTFFSLSIQLGLHCLKIGRCAVNN